jgi:hypothetical protein
LALTGFGPAAPEEASGQAEDAVRTAVAERDLHEHFAAGIAQPSATPHMREHAHLLVARPREPERFRVCAGTPADLGERHLAVVEAPDRVAETGRDSRRGGDHASSVAARGTDACVNFVPKRPARNSLLLAWCGLRMLAAGRALVRAVAPGARGGARA